MPKSFLVEIEKHGSDFLQIFLFLACVLKIFDPSQEASNYRIGQDNRYRNTHKPQIEPI